ncbi:MAG TPA: hypothetical protein VFZ61_12495 [Polyangiales bacterium]
MKPADFLHVLDNPDAPRLAAGGEGAELLRTLIVHLFYADKRVAPGEVALLARLLPHDDVDHYILEAGQRDLDLDRIATVFPDAKDRDDIITLAEHAVWGDNEIDSSEWDLVDQLVEKLGVVRT